MSPRSHSPAAPTAAAEGSPAPSALTPPAALANAALRAVAAGPSCCAERGASTASGRRPDPSVPPRARRPRGRRAASLRSPRRFGRPRQRDPSREGCCQPLPPAPEADPTSGDAQGPGDARHRRQGAGPSAGGPCAALPQSPLPRRRLGTPARGSLPRELEMPPRPRPPPLPSPTVPLPHVGRAAVSDPLPAPSRCH